MSEELWTKDLESFTKANFAGLDLGNILKLLRNPFGSQIGIPPKKKPINSSPRPQKKPSDSSRFLAPIATSLDRVRHEEARKWKNPSPACNLNNESSKNLGSSLGSQQRQNCSDHYLPIEEFKYGARILFCGAEIEKTFLSSGTSSIQRSNSLFSKKGFDLYRYESLSSFFAVMNLVAGENFWKMKGLSLIPNTKEWNTSSLAQMVSWISAYTPVQYCTEEDLNKNIASEKLNEDKPVWIFATAFHLMNYFDSNQKISLPRGSIIIETGGTKGKSREIERKDFYQLIADRFDIKQNQIISEYGMCELSAQAYDFVEKTSAPAKFNRKLSKKSSIDFSERNFKFPKWIKIEVTEGQNKFTTQGSGSLLISDPFRIDYPWGIRTQDVADICGQELGRNEFKLLGRVPGSVLKGCSLLAENISTTQIPNTKLLTNTDNTAEENLKFEVTTQTINQKISAKPRLLNQEKIDWIQNQLLNFLNSSSFIDSLTAEFKSKKIAQMAINSLIECLPESSSDWEQTVTKSNGLLAPKKSMLILPNNHSIAGFYPMVIGFLSEIKLTVRVPKKFTSSRSAINLFINFINSYEKIGDNKFETVNHSYRIENNSESNSDDFSSLIIYGSDETVSKLRVSFEGKVRGFGTRISLSALSKKDCDPSIKKIFEKYAERIITDVLSLRQMGCMSTRGVLLDSWTPTQVGSLQVALSLAAEKILGNSVSIKEKTSLDHLELEYKRNNVETALRLNSDSVLIPFFETSFQSKDKTEFVVKSVQNKNQTLDYYLAEIPLVIPLINLSKNFGNLGDFLKGSEVITEVIGSHSENFRDHKTIGDKSNFTNKTLGKSNLEPWDGLFQSVPLFLFD